MRKSYLLLIFVVLFAGMFGKLYADYPKFPLMERFTNTGCGPCKAYNDRSYSAWVAANHNKLAIITYHWDFPDPNDPLYHFNSEVTDGRMDFYTAVDAKGPLNAVPSVAFNGVLVGFMQQGQFISQPPNDQLNSLFATESAKRVPMNVTPTLEIVDGVAKIHVDIVSDEAMENIRLQVLIVESKVQFITAPGSTGEKEFPYLARYAKPSMAGTPFTIGASEAKSFDFDQVLDKKLNTNCLYVVAFVEPSNSSKSNTHSIVQAGMSVATIPMPIPVAAEIECLTTQPYEQAKKDAIITHTIYVTNTNDFDVQLEDIKVTNTLGDNDNWEFVSTTIPDVMPVIKPDEELAMEYNLKYVGTVPSSATVHVSFEAKITQEELDLLDGNYIGLSEPTNVAFASVSDNTKYAYMTNIDNVSGDENIYGAFSEATYFNNALVEIPFISQNLFAANQKIIDSLRFLGMSLDPVYWINDVGNGSQTINKLKSLPDLKLFVNSGGQTYFCQKIYFKDAYPTLCTSANNFLTEYFGVNSNGSKFGSTYQHQVQTYNGSRYTAFTINGITGDPIASQYPTLLVNNNGANDPGTTHTALFDELSANTTSVYTVTVNNSPETVMAKYQNGTNRRFITGFNFAVLPVLPATARPIETVANAIVDWLFDVNVIEDAEENINPTNGLLLQTQPNPVTSVSDVIVQNTNSMPVQAKVYLLDATGNKVMDLFEGMLGVGNNSMSLSNRNIAAGTYFIISETATGKTYMSVAISK